MKSRVFATVISFIVAGALGSCATVEAKPTPSPAPVSAPQAPSVTEGVAAMVQCLKQKGWDVNAYRDGWAFPGPADQLDIYLEDQMDCHSELGFDKLPPARMDDEHLTAMYGQEQELRDCLIEEGYDPPELPSMQKYKDDILTKGSVYSSYEAIGISMSDMSGIRDICADPLETWSS